MTTYIIFNNEDKVIARFDLKKEGAYWFLDAHTEKGRVLVGTYKTKKAGVASINRFAVEAKATYKAVDA